MLGILFKEDMFLQIVRGNKCQTRRIIKSVDPSFMFIGKGAEDYTTFEHPGTREVYGVYPKYRTHKVYYVKEPYAEVPVLDHYEFTIYQYDHKEPHEYHPDLFEKKIKWRPKIFMPGRKARYFLRIENIRVQGLTEISDEDVLQEGFDSVEQMEERWDQINGPGSFWSNPWVFAYTFTLLTGEELDENLLSGLR